MSKYIAESLRTLVREQDNGCCAYCHSPESLSLTPFEIDHILPLSRGGETEFHNLCLCCPSCNRYKSAQQFVVDLESALRAPLFHPRQEVWETHFRWSGDRLQIIGRTPTGRATIHALAMNHSRIIELRKVWAKLGHAPWVGPSLEGD
jgi:hypothetical protein